MYVVMDFGRCGKLMFNSGIVSVFILFCGCLWKDFDKTYYCGLHQKFVRKF